MRPSPSPFPPPPFPTLAAGAQPLPGPPEDEGHQVDGEEAGLEVGDKERLVVLLIHEYVLYICMDERM